MGVLAALGARPTLIFLAFYRDLASVAALSSVVGYGLGLVFTRLLATQVLNMSLALATTQLGAATLLPLCVMVSAAIPAWKASRMEPAQLLFRRG
jgi:ABC-type antimicrobial peptide transport system permease subunit